MVSSLKVRFFLLTQSTIMSKSRRDNLAKDENQLEGQVLRLNHI